MFDKFFKKNKLDFKLLYPTLVTYIKDSNKQTELAKDKTFAKKYHELSNTISIFLFEVKKYHTIDEIIIMVHKYIICLPLEDLNTLMINYLNLTDVEKSSRKYFEAYNETHGISNLTVDEVLLEEKTNDAFVKYDGNNRTFNGIPLKDLYSTLPLDLKVFLVSLMEKRKVYNTFYELFANKYHVNFKSLLRLLKSKSIDSHVLNEDYKNIITKEVNDHAYIDLIFTLLANDNVEITRYVKILLSKGEFETVEHLILNQLLSDELFDSTFDIQDSKNKTDKEIFNELQKVKKRIIK